MAEGALGSDGEDHGVEARRAEGGNAQGPALAHRHVAEIGDARVGEDLAELPPEAALHLVLVEEDPVLGEPARLDVTIEEENSASRRGERAGREESRRARAHDGNRVCRRFRHGGRP